MSTKHLIIFTGMFFSIGLFGFGQSDEVDLRRFIPAQDPFFGGPTSGGDLGSSHIGLFPAVKLPQEFVTAYFLNRVLFQGGTAYVEGPFDHFRPRGYSWGAYYPGYYASSWRMPRNYSSAYFVSEWIDRDPVEAFGGTGLEDSILLKEGMSQEDVMGVLGSPNQRIRLNRREVWKYSAFSLLFEAGVLVELR